MSRRSLMGVLACASALLVFAVVALAVPVVGDDVTYTTDAQFDQGTLVNVNHDAPNNNQLQLDETTSTFPRIFIATTNRSTVTRIDTNTGAILGEYAALPDPNKSGASTSRTTVGLDGTVWAGNRFSDGNVVHIGNPEANQCVDRNGNNTIETSSGYGDVLPWPDPAGTDFANGGVTTATDECILHFVQTTATVTRHVTIDANNDVWVSGIGGSNDRVFNKIDGDTGAIVQTVGPFGCGGYGGLIDQNGVIWSASGGGANAVLRWDPATAAGTAQCLAPDGYGMAVDLENEIWVTALCGSIYQLSNTTGANINGSPYPSNSNTGCQQGLTVDGNNHVWVSSSLFGGTVLQHYLNDGTFVGNVTGVGNGSTGVAVDSNGKIWTANINSSDATRIDPAAGPLGCGGTGCGSGITVGAVDLTVSLPGSFPYNYSDMTGNVALGTTQQGTWTVVQDGGEAGEQWGVADWTHSNPTKGTVKVEARAADSEAGLGSQAFVVVSDGAPFNLTGRFIEVRVTLTRDADGTSPILTDIRVRTTDDAPGLTGRMDGKGSLSGTGGTLSKFAFVLNCTAASNSTPAPFEGKKGSQALKVNSITTNTCTDDPLKTPAVPCRTVDTMEGTGTGKLGTVNVNVAWKFVDGGAGGASDSSYIKITRASNGDVLFEGTGAPPGKYPGSTQSTGMNTTLAPSGSCGGGA